MGRKKRAQKVKKDGATFVICGSGISDNYRHGVRLGGMSVEVAFVDGRFETDDDELIVVLEEQAARPGAWFARVE